MHIFIEERLVNALEWHARENGMEASDIVRDCIDSRLSNQARELWVSKRSGPPLKAIDIYKCYDIEKIKVECLGLIGEPHPRRVSKFVIEDLGLRGNQEFSSIADLFSDYQKSLSEGFRKCLYPGLFPEVDGVPRGSRATTSPAKNHSRSTTQGQAHKDVIELKPYRHIDDNWDPDAVK